VIIWTAFNSVTIVIVAGVVYLLLRQVGLILSNLGPAGARGLNVGPRMGENITAHARFAPIAEPAVRRATLYIFASAFCPICKNVREAAKAIAKTWRPLADLIMVYDGKASDDAQKILKADGSLWVTSAVGMRENLNIRTVPYAVMADESGVVTGHGLVNSASHLESLLEHWQLAYHRPHVESSINGTEARQERKGTMSHTKSEDCHVS
jgi:methylamine dehydrogenase accessory protein MauD